MKRNINPIYLFVFFGALLAMIAMCQRADAQMVMIPDLCGSSTQGVAAGQTQTWTGSRELDCVPVRGTLVLQGSLTATTIQVHEGGFLDIASGSSITFRNVAPTDPEQWGTGLIVEGRIRMLGAIKTPFVRLSVEPLQGANTLTLASAPTGWTVGDEVFVPDTRQTPLDDWFNPNFQLRHERRTLTAINGVTVTLSSPLSFDHRGARDASGALTVLADSTRLLPHVANLTRSITVRSASPAGTRGHGVFTNRANVEVRGVRFHDLGRTTDDTTTCAVGGATSTCVSGTTNQIGRYPVHFHHLRGPDNQTNTGYQFIFTDNAVVDSLKWPIAIHASHFGRVCGNVIIGGSQNTGAGIALEDGTETDNLICDNFVADIRGNENPRNTGTSNPSDGLHTGTGGECIWGAGFNNRFVGNVVSGCRNVAQNIVSGVGFKFFMHAAPNSSNWRNPRFRGADMGDVNQTLAVNGQSQPILQFENNEAYGLMADGLTIWHQGTDGGQWNASQPETVIRNFRVWHAYEGAFYGYPTNRLTFDGLVFRVDQSVARPDAINTGDYRTVHFAMRNGDIHARSVIGWDNSDFMETVRLENVTATTHGHAFFFRTPATPGTQASRGATGVDITIVNPVITAWPGQPSRLLQLSHDLSRTPNWPNAPFRVYLTEGAITSQVCFAIQASQNLYGGICAGSASRPEIDGIIVGGVAPPPPPPPPAEVCGDGIDNDLDGQIDEGCPVTPPSPPGCTTIAVSPTSVAWSVAQGTVPSQTSIAVSTCNAQPWNTFDTSDFYDATAACAFNTCPSGTSTTLTPVASIASRALGTYRHDLRVRSSGLVEVVVPVTLTITSGAPPPPPPPPPQEVCGDTIDNDGDGAIDEGCPVVPPPPPPQPTDPCVTDPLLVTRIAWPTTNTGRRTLTFDVGTKRWASVSMTWPGTLTVIDTRGCSATVTR